MNSIILKNIVRFLALVFLQVFIFNKIYLSGYINPYVFIMFVIMLPFDTPWWILLLSSFGIGLSIDVFTGSLGVHAAATTLVAFSRPAIIKSLLPKIDKGITVFPGISFMGVPTFALFSFILVFIHNLFFFTVEVMSFYEFWHILLRVILSSIITTLLIVILEMIFRKK